MFHLRKAGNHRPDMIMKRQGREEREGRRRGGAAAALGDRHCHPHIADGKARFPPSCQAFHTVLWAMGGGGGQNILATIWLWCPKEWYRRESVSSSEARGAEWQQRCPGT